jgi:ribosome recycling factor
MTEEIQMALELARGAMDKAISHMETELTKIRAGKAHPAMLDNVMVEYYGSMTPLTQVSNINTSDARTLTVQAWEKAMLDPIATAIINANLGLNPMNNGESILINIPPLTEERRKDLTKRARAEGEPAKTPTTSSRRLRPTA